MKISNSCEIERDFCLNCNSLFRSIRPTIVEAVVSKRFARDLKDRGEMNSIIKKITECSYLDFNELHKFEKKVDGNMVFRAKKGKSHVVYSVDKNGRIIFLRTIGNFKEYKNFLENEKLIKTMIERL